MIELIIMAAVVLSTINYIAGWICLHTLDKRYRKKVEEHEACSGKILCKEEDR